MQRLHARDRREGELLAPGHKFAHHMRIGAACVRSSARSSQSPRMPASEALVKLALSAMKSHSLAPSLRYSGVGSTQEPTIQFAMLKCCFSA
jgi:hypothetical protein